MQTPFPLLLAVLATTLAPTNAMAQLRGYYPQQQHWYGQGSQNWNRPWPAPVQNLLESIEYNGVIIVHQQVPPRTDICPWVVNRGLPCEGYLGFDSSRRTHVFRNNGGVNRNWYGQGSQNWNRPWPAPVQNPRWHQNKQYPSWNNNQPWGHNTPSWNGGCVYQNQHVRILCN